MLPKQNVKKLTSNGSTATATHPVGRIREAVRILHGHLGLVELPERPHHLPRELASERDVSRSTLVPRRGSEYEPHPTHPRGE